MDNNDLVSVVITTYKRDINILMQAIKSVKEQSYPYIEIIIIDDNGIGTKWQIDNSEIINKQEHDLCYIANETNQGAQVSRNKGILLSKGKYVAFLDDDDLWKPTKIEKQIRYLKENDLDMVFCNGDRFIDGRPNETTPYQRNPEFSKNITFEMELRTDFIGSTSQAMIKKDCFCKVGLFDPDMPARQDYEMWLRMTMFFRVRGIDDSLFLYRLHEGERISKSADKCIRSYRILLNKYKKFYNKDRIAKSNVMFMMARYYSYDKAYLRIITHISYAFLLAPHNTIKQIKAIGKNDR